MNRWLKIIALIILIGVIVALPFGLWHWLLIVTGSVNEPGAYYGFWSGFAGDLTLFTAIAVWYRKHNCHDHACWRIGKHQVADGQFLVCHRHFKQINGLPPSHKITVHHIGRTHRGES